MDDDELPFLTLKINDINIPLHLWRSRPTEREYLFNADERILEARITVLITSPSELNLTFSLPMYDASNPGILIPFSKPSENLNIMVEPVMNYVR